MSALPSHPTIAGVEINERSLLGAIMLAKDGGLIAKARKRLGDSPDAFSGELNQSVYAAMVMLDDDAKVPEMPLVWAALQGQFSPIEVSDMTKDATCQFDTILHEIADACERRKMSQTFRSAQALCDRGDVPASKIRDTVSINLASIKGRERSDTPMVCMAEVEREELEWLWTGRIPKGKLIVMDGDPAIGKSTITCDLAARISTGRPMPLDNDNSRDAAGVIMWCPEDGLGDTVKVRLEAAGADCTKVHCLKEGSVPQLPKAIEWLRESIIEHNVALVIIDPLFGFTGDADPYKDASIRQKVMTPLVSLASETGASILCIRHPTKGPKEKAIHAGGGSVGIGGAARVVLTVARSHDGRRCVAVAKGNLSSSAKTLVYEVESDKDGAPYIEWTGTCDLTADDLVSAPPVSKPSKVEDGKDLLQGELSAGPVEAKEIEARAREIGISRATLRRAEKELGVQKRKAGFDGGWVWQLPVSSEGAHH